MTLMSPELDALLVEDAELCKELTAAGGSWQSASEWLLDMERQRIEAIKKAIVDAKQARSQARFLAGLNKFDQAAATERLKNPVWLRADGTPDVSGKDVGGASVPPPSKEPVEVWE